MLYFNIEFGEEMMLNSLRALHPIIKLPNFRVKCFEDHKFTSAIFDNFVKQAVGLFERSFKEKNFSNVTLACSLIGVFLDHFVDKADGFKPIVIDVIHIVKEKADASRQSAAVVLAKLAKDEEMNKYIRANHGFEVLVSLRNQFIK